MVDYDPQTDHTPQVLNERSGAPWLELIEVALGIGKRIDTKFPPLVSDLC